MNALKTLAALIVVAVLSFIGLFLLKGEDESLTKTIYHFECSSGFRTEVFVNHVGQSGISREGVVYYYIDGLRNSYKMNSGEHCKLVKHEI